MKKRTCRVMAAGFCSLLAASSIVAGQVDGSCPLAKEDPTNCPNYDKNKGPGLGIGPKDGRGQNVGRGSGPQDGRGQGRGRKKGRRGQGRGLAPRDGRAQGRGRGLGPCGLGKNNNTNQGDAA